MRRLDASPEGGPLTGARTHESRPGSYVLIDVVVNHMANMLKFDGVPSDEGAPYVITNEEYTLSPRAGASSMGPIPAEGQPYRDFQAHVASIAATERAAVLDSFSGTWSGVHAGCLAHHDSTRIHFSDTGRAYLAQLTLNALALTLPRPPALPPPARAASLHLDELLAPQARR